MSEVTFCGVSYDPASPLIFRLDAGSSGFGSVSRRVSKTAALDATVVFQDFGQTVQDKDLTLVLSGPDLDDITSLKTIMELTGMCRVNYGIDSCYKCRFVDIAERGIDFVVKLYVDEDLTIA